MNSLETSIKDQMMKDEAAEFGRIYQEMHSFNRTDDVQASLDYCARGLTTEKVGSLIFLVRNRKYEQAFDFLNGAIAEAVDSQALFAALNGWQKCYAEKKASLERKD